METLKLFSVLYVSSFLLSIPGMWYIFKKLGIAPWKSLIPIYNFIVLMIFFKISLWLLLLIIFPYALVILEFIIAYKMAKSFDKGIGFAIGLSFWFTRPIFITILGLGKYEFIGTEGLI